MPFGTHAATTFSTTWSGTSKTGQGGGEKTQKIGFSSNARQEVDISSSPTTTIFAEYDCDNMLQLTWRDHLCTRALNTEL